MSISHFAETKKVLSSCFLQRIPPSNPTQHSFCFPEKYGKNLLLQSCCYIATFFFSWFLLCKKNASSPSPSLPRSPPPPPPLAVVCVERSFPHVLQRVLDSSSLLKGPLPLSSLSLSLSPLANFFLLLLPPETHKLRREKVTSALAG